MAIKNKDLDLALKGKNESNLNVTIHGTEVLSEDLSFVLFGVQAKNNTLNLTLQGKKLNELTAVLKSKAQDELGIVIKAIDPDDIYAVYGFDESEMDEFKITSGDLVNEVEVLYAYDYVEGKFKGAITKENPLSKLMYRGEKRKYEMYMLQTARQAESFADAVLKTHSIPEIICSFKHDIRSFFVEVGDLTSITHRNGIQAGGYIKTLGTVISKLMQGGKIGYKVNVAPSDKLYKTQLKSFSRVATGGRAGLAIQYEKGVATMTIYADVAGYPPIQGVEVTINSVKKISDSKGQVRFNLQPGTYTAYMAAAGYENTEETFTV